MSTSKPSSVTVEEAVARMINLEYIPTGFALLDMTWAYQEEAEVAYENAPIDHLPGDQIAKLKMRMDACRARHVLTQLLLEDLKHELDNPKDSMVIRSSDSSSQPRLTLESVSDWASAKYGIEIPEWSQSVPSTDDQDKPVQNVPWEQVTIKIYKDYRIAYFSGKEGHKKEMTFQDIGLIDKRNNKPSNQAEILLGLSNRVKFPDGKVAAANEKTAISKLRHALKKLTGLLGDPFYPIAEDGGWKPRFKLIDDRRNADERAKKKARHVNFEEAEAPDFDDENDEGGKFIDNND